MVENILYYGDNLDILQRYIKDETIDLIYLDPPFFSNRNYEIIWGDEVEISVFKADTAKARSLLSQFL
jgi:16S rRNA G966 N2-methylase RsmD